MPVKITPAGGYASRMKIRLQIPGESALRAHQASASANGCRKRIVDIYNRI